MRLSPVGENKDGQCDTEDWHDIVAISASDSDGSFSGHTIGLKADGRVVSVGSKYGQCDVQSWRDIVAVSTCATHTVGLKADGSVVAVGKMYSVIAMYKTGVILLRFPFIIIVPLG